MSTARASRVIAVLFVAGLLAACGSGAGGDHAGGHAEESVVEPVAGASEVTVTAVDVDYQPESLELTAGEPVNITITNEGAAEHDFTLEEAGVHVNLAPGQSLTTSVSVPEAGKYEALCTIAGHADAGMKIEVTVVE
jgi:uncharacterized cupredoxin-like copper-binding protein